MESFNMPRKLWEPRQPEATQMYDFIQTMNRSLGLELESFQDLSEYSFTHRSTFYAQLFDWANIIHTGRASAVVDESSTIESVPRWFSGVSLNWAENILFSRGASGACDHRGTTGKEDNKVAVTEIREGNTRIRDMSWATLRRDAGRLAAGLKMRGVQRGDRVVVVGSNSINTLLVFLATTWLGAVFSSSSTDMGVDGILQRTIQIDPKASLTAFYRQQTLLLPLANQPKIIFFDDVAVYNGKITKLEPKIRSVLDGMKSCENLLGLVVMPRLGSDIDVSAIPGATSLSSLLSRVSSTDHPPFSQLPFHAPLLICYSSGTTGNPKPIVHSVGGVLLNLVKEGRLHDSISADSVVLQYTTTGWIMYVLQVANLLIGARVVLYDGSPFTPDRTTLIKILAQQRVTAFGTSPRWMHEMAKNDIRPREIANLEALQTVTSTGMVLSDQLFEWVYDTGFPPSIRLINKSGGTDIAGCFGTGNPLSPVYVGGTQGPSLGVPISIYDVSKEVGVPVPLGVIGELVATAAFPNMPCFFWGDSSSLDPAPPGSKYHSSYFGRFPQTWTHGDLCMIHPGTLNIHFLGRADGVLNPSGIRFGSSEIYAVIDRHFSDQIEDSLCVGQRRPQDVDESVILFLLVREGQQFSRELVVNVKKAIGRDLSKRHIPRYVFETPEIPVTATHKKVELPVKQIVSGQKVKPSSSLLNPSSLSYYYQFVNVEKLAPETSRL